MPDITQEQINLYDVNQDKQLTQADVDFAISIGLTSIATTIQSILTTGTGTLDVVTAGAEMSGEGYQDFLADPQSTINVFNQNTTENAVNEETLSRVFNAFQSGISTYSATASSKRVLDWSAFWSETNVPTIGYDAIDDKLVVLKGADHSADASKDILVYDFITGSWTKGDTKLSGSNDMTNMITAPDTGELVVVHQHNSTGILRRFKAHQSANISSSTVNIVTPFFDFGSSGQKKRLYKVEVLARGTNLDDLAIIAAYDGNASASYAGYSNIFSSNTFSNTTALDWDKKTFTVSSPTDFNNVSVRIYSSGAMTTADWGISEITFIYRAKGIR